MFKKITFIAFLGLSLFPFTSRAAVVHQTTCPTETSYSCITAIDDLESKNLTPLDIRLIALRLRRIAKQYEIVFSLTPKIGLMEMIVEQNKYGVFPIEN